MKKRFSIPDIVSSEVFLTDSWQQHLDLISHLSQFTQDVLLVISAKGGGKTTFAKYFIDMPTTKIQKSIVTATKDTHWDQLLAEIIKVLELPLESSQDIQALQTQIQTIYNEQEVPRVLLIDDAHLLSDETLQNLLKLISFNKRAAQLPLHVILFTEPSLELRLFASKFTSLIYGRFYSVELEAWSLAELVSYFEQTTFSALNPEQIALIFERSRGLPGYVIQEAQEITLLSKAGKNMKKFDLKRWCSRPILIGVVMGVTLGTTFLFVNNVEEEGSTSIPINMAQIAENEWENQDDAPRKSITFQFDKSDEEEQIKLDAEKESLGALPQIEQTQALQDPDMMEDTPESIALSQAQNSQAILQAPVEKRDEENVVIEKMTKKPIVADQFSLNTKEQHLLKTAAHHYTIQLLGARSEESIKQFIQHHAIEASAHYYRTQLGGKDWYVMVYGDFSSRNDAKAAIEKLPYSLQNEKLQPWIRELSSIQQDIRERQA